MASVAFLKTNPNPTRTELAHGLSGNLCRCQDYDKILTAMMRGAENMRRAQPCIRAIPNLSQRLSQQPRACMDPDTN